MSIRYCNDCGTEPLRYNNRSGFCRKCYERNRPRALRGTPEWEENNQQQKLRYLQDIERRRHAPKIARFKLTLEKFNAMREEQEYSCALCGQHEDIVGTLNIDHDHACCPGKITCGECLRELLCTDCNQGLGRFHDNEQLLQAAIFYLQRNKKG